LEEVANRTHRFLKDVLNETIKPGLILQYGETDNPPLIKNQAVETRIKAGTDEGRLDAYLDEPDEGKNLVGRAS
jgi:hypothetical protein